MNLNEEWRPGREELSDAVQAAGLSGIDAWDRVYSNQGRLWGGAVHPIEKLPKGTRVLELGCGSGKLLAAVAGREAECIALDFSKTACHLARRAVRDPAVTILTADVRRIPLVSECIDVVLANHVAGHLMEGDRMTLFQEAARVLRKGGQLIFRDFSEHDFRAGKGRKVENRTYMRGNGIITHYFTEDEIRSIQGPLCICNLATEPRPMVVNGKPYSRAELIASFIRL